jgi:hypothetical protein
MGSAVDVHAAHSANTLPTIMIKGHRFPALPNKLFVEKIHHLQKGGVYRNRSKFIVLEATLGLGGCLSPHTEFQS